MNFNLPAIAAFANAVLQLVALVALVIMAGPAQPALAESWRVAFQLYLWPIPFVTAVTLFGLIGLPATQDMRISMLGAAALFGVSTWLMWLAASIGLDTLSGENRPEAFMAVMLAPLPAYILAGIAAAVLSQKLSTRFPTPKWFVALGVGVTLATLATFVVIPSLYIAMLLLAVWWASIGFTLSQTPRARTVTT